MTSISTHVLDLAQGKPAAGIPVSLEMRGADGAWHPAGHGITNQDGRCADLASSEKMSAGTYRLTWETEEYLLRSSRPAFFPQVVAIFTVTGEQQRYHIPLLLSPYGYSTYRGS